MYNNEFDFFFDDSYIYKYFALLFFFLRDILVLNLIVYGLVNILYYMKIDNLHYKLCTIHRNLDIKSYVAFPFLNISNLYI